MNKLAVYALSALVASYTPGCSFREIEKQRTRAERTNSLISLVRVEYDAIKESENYDPERTRNYVDSSYKYMILGPYIRERR